MGLRPKSLTIKNGAAAKQNPTSNSTNTDSNTNKGSGRKIAASELDQNSDAGPFEQNQRHDFITVLKTAKPCNKRVSKKSDGTLRKQPANQITIARAQTFYVPDMGTAKELFLHLSRDTKATIVLGYIPGTEPPEGELKGEPYNIVSRKKLASLLKIAKRDCPSGLIKIDGEIYATRTKNNFIFSSWVMFDYDRVKGMPMELETDDPAIWLDWQKDLITGFEGVGYIFTPSTTSRIMLDGKPAYHNGGWHVYVQVKNAEDIGRFGSNLLIHALSTPYGFMRPIFSEDSGEIISHRPWATFDPSTFSPERLVYDGCPIVQGNGLTVAEPNIKLCEGKRLDTSLLVVNEEIAGKVKEKTGLKIEKSSGSSINIYSLINDRDLKLSTSVDTEIGVMTIGDFWASDHDKLRAQALFRPESTSWAAFLSRHDDGTPFLYDIGLQTKYTLSGAEVSSYKLDVAMNWVEESDESDVKNNWLVHAKDLDVITRDLLRRAVNKKTNIGKRELKSELNDAIKKWKAESISQIKASSKTEKQGQGKIVIDWSAAELPDVVAAVKKQLRRHTAPGHVFSYGDRLVTVTKCQPKSVRQIVRKATEGDDYPDQYLVHRFTLTTCMVRVLESVAFRVKDYFIGCPTVIAQALLDDSSFAKPLSGLLEVPSVMPDGRLLNVPGFDEMSGYYCTFDKSLTRNLPVSPARSDAVEALKYITDVVFDGFPFRSDTDLFAAVAFLLTAFVRRFLGNAPGFMVTASVQSSGKSTLADIVFQAAYGRPAAAASWTPNEEEMEKHILAILLEGQSGVCFDNLPHGCRVDGAELSKLITQELYQARKLGKNESATVPTNILVAITGNQLTPINDMVTRLLPINLVPDVECPENRTFERKNINAWHADNRPEIVTAVWTILLAWLRSDVVIDREPSRFPEWDEVVRKALIWLGAVDINIQFDDNKDEDPIRELRCAFVHAWHKEFSNEWVELAEVLDKWPDDPSDFDNSESGLEVVLLELFPKGCPTARRAGSNFRHFKDVVFDGLKLVQEKSKSKSKASRPWRVCTVGAS